jgi:hypothetical protein
VPVTGIRLSETVATASPQLVMLYLSSLDQELVRSIKPVFSAPVGAMCWRLRLVKTCA